MQLALAFANEVRRPQRRTRNQNTDFRIVSDGAFVGAPVSAEREISSECGPRRAVELEFDAVVQSLLTSVVDVLLNPMPGVRQASPVFVRTSPGIPLAAREP